MLSLRQAMDRLFDDSFIRSPLGSFGDNSLGSWSDHALALDVRSTADALVVEAALPGVKPEDVDITIEAGTLTIKGAYGTDRSESEGEYVVRELRRGSFGRTVSLPQGLEADKAEATFESGVLTLRIPKAEQTKPRQIRISPVSAGEAKPVASGQAGEPAVSDQPSEA
jgi:HSP20 family protein